MARRKRPIRGLVAPRHKPRARGRRVARSRGSIVMQDAGLRLTGQRFAVLVGRLSAWRFSRTDQRPGVWVGWLTPLDRLRAGRLPQLGVLVSESRDWSEELFGNLADYGVDRVTNIGDRAECGLGDQLVGVHG